MGFWAGALILADGHVARLQGRLGEWGIGRRWLFPLCPVLLKHLLLKHILPLQGRLVNTGWLQLGLRDPG